MKRIFEIKNWEIFLILILIPFLIQINLPFLTNNLVAPIIFTELWIFCISLWLYNLSINFRTVYINKLEIRIFNLNLLVLNLIFIISGLIFLILIYKDQSIFKSKLDLISRINNLLQIYYYLAIVSIPIIASRILTAYKLQRKVKIIDYYKSAISNLFLPVGIFWIQNEINKISETGRSDNKKRSYILIGITFILVITTILIFNDKKIKINFGNNTNEKDQLIKDFIENNQQENDSILKSMSDSSKAEYIFKSVKDLYKSGKFREAINNINLSIQLDSLNSDYYYNRGIILYEQFNELDSAIMDMKRTIELDSSYWQAYHNRGYYNYLLEKFDKVMPDLDKAIELKSDFSNTYLLRSILKETLGYKDGACSDLKKADSLGNEEASLKILLNCN
jgi:tetratricopeptide (TPR) repeat protein